MMRKLIFIMVVMLSANLCLAGNVKVMKTKYVGADYDVMSGPYMTVNVKLLASHVAAEECACFVLVNNEQWDGENMTISKLSKLAKTMCIGEAELDAVSASKILEIPMSISLDQQRLTGRDTVFYMKTVVVDFTKKDVIAQSDMISFSIDAQRTSEQMLGSVGSAGLGLFMGLLSSDSEKDENCKECPSCHGRKYIQNPDDLCSTCEGKGKVFKDLWDRGMDEYRDAQKRKAQGQNGSRGKVKQKQQQSEDDGLDGLLDGLFGF